MVSPLSRTRDNASFHVARRSDWCCYIFVNMCLNKVNPPYHGVQHLISLVWLEEM